MPPLRAFSQPLAIVDLETTGGRALQDRITEIAILQVDADGVREWSSLVRPGVAIPPFITRLTGIGDDTVAAAPTFAELAPEIAELLRGRLFVAHNARFDYGFLKAEFERAGLRFQTRSLCTVRLSRTLDPALPRHGLDAVVASYGITVASRHRARDDARAVLDFLAGAEARHGAEAVAAAVALLSRRPTLPSYLDESLADRLPEMPGVYFFHGEAGLLYVGKAVNLRKRVLGHFAADLTDAKEMRLSQQVRDITWETTAGELGALLREARYIKQLQPLHNRQLRRQSQLVSLALTEGPDGSLRPLAVNGQGLRQGRRLYGLFNSRAAAIRLLREIGTRHGLCDYALGLEKPARRPCPSRQLKRCQGLCDGGESAETHNRRLLAALETQALLTWPHDGPVVLEEVHPASGQRELHLVDNWCWLGSAGSEEALQACVAQPLVPRLDRDSYRLLVQALFGRKTLRTGRVDAAGRITMDADTEERLPC